MSSTIQIFLVLLVFCCALLSLLRGPRDASGRVPGATEARLDYEVASTKR